MRWVLRGIVDRGSRWRQIEVPGLWRGQVEEIVSEDHSGWRRERKGAGKSRNVGHGSFCGSDGGGLLGLRFAPSNRQSSALDDL